MWSILERVYSDGHRKLAFGKAYAFYEGFQGSLDIANKENEVMVLQRQKAASIEYSIRI